MERETLLQRSKIWKQGSSLPLGSYINLLNLGPASGVVSLLMTEVSRLQPQSSGQRQGKENHSMAYSQKGDLTARVCQNAVPPKLKEPDFHCLHENTELFYDL